jgi:hypothetical protein
MRVVYIGGIEHNGSTLLGLTLGNHPQIECIGELSQLPRLGWAGDQLCACGENIADCQYWRNVRQTWSGITQADIDVLITAENIFDRNSSLPRLLLEKNIRSAAFARYSSQPRVLFEAIQHITGKPVIVDTSKRVSRALALSMMEGIDLRLIHLVRDARGVAHSSAKPQRAIQREWWKSAARWHYINGSFRIVSHMLDKEKIMIVRYEDFIAQPEELLAQIGDFIGVDLTSVASVLSSGGALASGHIGIGNGFLQGEQQIVLRRTIDWPQKMPRDDQRKVWRVTARSMRRYGYREEPDDLV